MQSTKITFIVSDLGSGGAQRVLTTIANSWATQGRSVCVITLADANRDFFPLHPSITRRIVGGIHDSKYPWEAIWMNLRRMILLRRCLRETQSSFVVSFVGTTNIITLLATLGLGIRVVISERNDPARQSLGRVWDFLRWTMYRFADRVTANSKGVLKTLETFVPSHKLAYVPNPLSIPEQNEAMPIHPPTILAVGRLYPQKGYDILLPAFARAASNFPEWRLNILGEGPLKETLARQTEELTIQNRVNWLGRSENPFYHYRSSDIFVLSSRHEGMPNSMLEAMACEMPIIVTDASPGPLEYIEHEQTGLVVPAENIQSLADALQRLMKDPHLRLRLGQKARERVSDCELSHVLQIWERVLDF